MNKQELILKFSEIAFREYLHAYFNRSVVVAGENWQHQHIEQKCHEAYLWATTMADEIINNENEVTNNGCFINAITESK